MISDICTSSAITLQERLCAVQEEIAKALHSAGRSEDEVQLIAVTKFHSLEEMVPLWDLGIRHWGENRVQELCAKATALAQSQPQIQPSWHFIGTLQTNKVRKLPTDVYRIHSVDRMELVQALQEDARRRNWSPKILLQVNLSGECSKHGFSAATLLSSWEEILQYDALQIQGLMTMAPQGATKVELLELFSALRELAKQLRGTLLASERSRVPMEELSMGMSRDFPEAILCGATWIRVGTAILGPRNYISERLQDSNNPAVCPADT